MTSMSASYLPLLIALWQISRVNVEATTASSVLAGCPEPTAPLFVSVSNEKSAIVDSSQYKPDSTTLPLKCLSADFTLETEVKATCQGGKWTMPKYKCLGVIEIERKKTNIIMIAAGVVCGSLAAIFVIVKVILHIRGKRKHMEQAGDNNIELSYRPHSQAYVTDDHQQNTRTDWHAFGPHHDSRPVNVDNPIYIEETYEDIDHAHNNGGYANDDDRHAHNDRHAHSANRLSSTYTHTST